MEDLALYYDAINPPGVLAEGEAAETLQLYQFAFLAMK